MTSDPLRERVARVLHPLLYVGADADGLAAAVLADLREAGAVLGQDEYEQVGYIRGDRSMFVTASGPLRGTEPPEGWEPVFVRRAGEGTPPTCPRCGEDPVPEAE